MENRETVASSNGLSQSDARSQWYIHAMGQLVGVVQELSLAHDLPNVMDVVRRAARELTGADGATFVLREGDQCFYAEENAISPLWKGKRFPMSICISGWVMMNREPAVIEDIYNDSRIPVEAYRPTFVKSLAMVPIRTRDPVGAIGNYWATVHCPSLEQVKILQALADTTAVALENVRVYAELNQKIRDMAALMHAAPVAIVSLDPEGAPQTWNQAAEWHRAGLDLQLAVNLSVANLQDRQLPDLLAELCAGEGVEPDHVTLELTETASTKDYVLLLEVLSRFRIKGFHLPIDDFGTGYSLVIQLLRLPFSELKIDKSFVSEMDHVREAAVVVKTPIDMAHNLELLAVAEGVETHKCLEMLREWGCDIAQGYYFSKPVEAEQIKNVEMALRK